jgi:hypothetical protein
MKMLRPTSLFARAAVWYAILLGACLVLAVPSRAAAQQQGAPLPLPVVARCERTLHPELPVRWRGVFLMAPFHKAQLVLSDIVYDGAIPAMQVKLYGVRSGAANLLVLGNTTYLLSADGANDQCQELGDTGWRPLPRDWLAVGAKCVGAAPISETLVDWWKAPTGSASLADWLWFKSADRSPFRLLFEKPSEWLSILSSYALSYQVSFETLSQSDLPAVAASCQNAKQHTQQSGRKALRSLLDAMDRSRSRASAEIKRLMPELAVDCSKLPSPAWPESLAMTMLLTPLKFHANPFPSEVRYDWKSRSQRTRMFWPTGSPVLVEDVLMLGAHGYSVTRKQSGAVQCIAALPGTPRPGWISEAPCACEGVINGTTPLTPYGPVQILRCPATEPRLFWTWYTLEGRPMVFMVTPSSGNEPTALITLADYYTWLPGYPSEKPDFTRPTQCPAPELGLRVMSRYPRAPSNEPCGRCHLTADAPH